MSRLLLLIALAPLSLAADVEPAGAEWPMFRGPKRDGISPDKGLLKVWPKAGPKLVWKAAGAGLGLSSVTVAAGKVFTMGSKDGKTFILAYDAAKGGEPLWSTDIGKGGKENYDGARCTPSYSDGMVYGVSAFGDFAAVSADKGEVKWRKDYKKDFKGIPGSWQFSESPLIDGDRVIITPGGTDATLVCLDKKTGEEVWRSAAGKTAGYSSVVISNAAGVKQYVQQCQSSVFGVNAADGKRLWHFDKLSTIANIPTPIPLGDQILTMAGYGKPVYLLTLASEGGEVKMTEKKFDLRGNKHGGALVVGDLMFSDADDSGRPYAAEWKTGKMVWQRAREGKGGGSASLAYADGMLYVRYANGTVSLVPAGGTTYEEKGTFSLPALKGRRGSSNWAHPVVIGGRLYLRNDDDLFCYDVKAK